MDEHERANLSLSTPRTDIQDRSLSHFAEYWEEIKLALLERDHPVTIVFGNKAGDLDSMASAITIAYNMHVANLMDPAEGDEHRAFVPMINISRADLRLRPEVIRAFEVAFKEGTQEIMQASDLFARVPFRDETNLDCLADRKNLRLILTDHNKLALFQNFGDLSTRVSGVFDHHADENHYLNAKDRIMEAVGSCCTLSARLWMGNTEAMTTYMPRELSHLLLYAILVDTDTLHSSVSTETDKTCAKFLYSNLGLEATKDARKA